MFNYYKYFYNFSKLFFIVTASCLVINLLYLDQSYAVTPPAGSTITNTVRVQYKYAGGNIYKDVTASVSTTLVVNQKPAISINKSASTAMTAPGGIIKYTIQYKNTGNVDAQNVIIKDALPLNTEYIKDSITGPGILEDKAINWYMGTLLSGKEGLVSFQVKVSNSSKDGDIIQNTASLNGDDVSAVSNKTSTIIANQIPLISISKSASTEMTTPGGVITYTIQYKNIGNIAAYNLMIKDDIPLNTEYVKDSVTGPGILNSKTINWNMGTLLPGVEGTISFQAKVSNNAKDGDIIQNTSYLSADQLSITSNTTETKVNKPSISLIKSASTEMTTLGGIIKYTIQYKNIGKIAAQNVVINDDIPLNTEYIKDSITGPGILNSKTINWNIGTLPVSGEGLVSFKAKVSTNSKDGDVIENTASLSADQLSIISNKAETKVFQPLISIIKSASTEATIPGGLIKYTIQYKNIGKISAQNVVIIDDIPLNSDYIADSITGPGIINNKTINWNIGTLQIGGEGGVSFQIKVSPYAKVGDTIQNTASLSADQISIISNKTSAIINYISIQKAGNPEQVYLNNQISYKIEVANNTQNLLTNVKIVDTLPSETTFVSADEKGELNGSEVIWNLGNLSIGTKKLLTLVLKVNSLPPGDQILTNKVKANSDESPYQSSTATATNKVIFRTKPEITFLDISGNQVSSYPVNSKMCIQVKDLDRNVNPDISEQISVVLKDNVTNDEETVTLNEINPADGSLANNTGIFRACISNNTGNAISNDNNLTTAKDSEIVVIYRDPDDINCGYPIETKANVYIDPLGIVFDSVTGLPVSGVTVTIIDDATGMPTDLPQPPFVPNPQSNSVTTDANGKFQFEFMNPGTYHFRLTNLTDYTFPSSVNTNQLPNGFNIGTGSKGESFSVTKEKGLINLDIPIDPPFGRLLITKSVNKNGAEIGDILQYNVRITNDGRSPVSDITVTDIMPHGIGYIKNTTLINGSRAMDPVNSGNRTLTWKAGTLSKGENIELVYKASIGPDADKGNGKNMVSASGISVGRAVSSNNAYATVKIKEGVFTSQATIIGNVSFYEEEKGVPDIVIYLEDGTRVITDENGNYSIHSVKHGTHVLRVDEKSLPDGFELVSLNNRFMGDGKSQFIDILYGGLLKANFAIKRNSEKKKDMEIKIQKTQLTNLNTDKKEVSQIPLEKQILTMTPELQIISPVDKTISSTNRIHIIVKSPLDKKPTLSVNNKSVDSKQIGKTIINEAGRVAIYEYIDVELLPGRVNVLTASNLKEKNQVSVILPGKPSKIIIKSDKTEYPADGTSKIPVHISIKDRDGQNIIYPSKITVETSAGQIIEKDDDSANSGHQIPYQDGKSQFTILAPRESGEANITVNYEDIKETFKIFFSPNITDTFMVGIGEIVLGHGKSSGDMSYIKDRKWFDDGVYTGARGAFFLKENIFKDYLLTASYDSEKKKTDDLFKQSETDLEAIDKYPIYGDGSKLSYEAVSTDRLYAKLEKNKSYLLYGDFRTEFTDTKLSAYTRSFNGLKTDIQTDKFRLQSFGSYTNQTQVLDALPAKGISGYYFLSYQSILEGSERVVIETRDRLQIDRVLNRDTKMRGSDYEIDYDMGTILFKNPVSTHDKDFNPIYVIVSYESKNDNNNYYIYGGRATYKLTEWLEIGGTGITNEKAVTNYELWGADSKLKLPFNTTLKTEYAQTKSFIDVNNTFKNELGDGLLLDFESKPIDRLSLTGFYRDIDNYFDNQSAIDMMMGTKKYGFDSSYEINNNLKIKGKYLDEDDNLNHKFEAVGIEKTIKKTKIGIELSRETSSDKYVPPAGYLNRVPFDNSFETPHELNSGKIGVETELFKDLTIKASHKNNLGSDSFHNTQAGLKYQINKSNSLYVSEEYQKYLMSEQTRTILGVESNVFNNTNLYNEYQLTDGADGSRNQQVIGLKTKTKLKDDLTGNIAAEYLSTLSGLKRTGEPDAVALSTALEYLPKKDFKVTGRFEYRHEITDNGRDSYLTELGTAYKIKPGYTLLFNERYFSEKLSMTGEHQTSRTMLGLAFRPINYDSFSALSKIDYKFDKNNTVNPGISQDAIIFSSEGVFQYTKKMQLIGRYAGKLLLDNDVSSYTDLISGKILYDLTKRIDMSAEYRLFSNHLLNTIQQGGALELGYRIIKNLWLSAGYSFDRFDSDLVGDNYYGEGPYIKLRFKFDENLFKKSSKNRIY